MTAGKALGSEVLLNQYCKDRYGIELTLRQLAKIVSAHSFFQAVDIDVWLKLRLTELGCFLCGCKLPPLLRLITKLHMEWSKGEITVPLSCVVMSDKYKVDDRHRAGKTPSCPEDEYDGQYYRVSYNPMRES